MMSGQENLACAKQWGFKWQVKENVFVETDHKDSVYQPSTDNVHNRLIHRAKLCASSFLRLEKWEAHRVMDTWHTFLFEVLIINTIQDRV